MLREQKRRARRRFLLQVAGAAGCAAVGGLVYLAARPDDDGQHAGGDFTIAGISCREVHDHAQAYVRNDDSLAEDLRNRIAAHVKKCGPCAKHLRRLRSERGRQS